MTPVLDGLDPSCRSPREQAMPKLKYIHIPPEKIAEGRRRYEETNELNEDIAAFLGISPSTFKSRRRQWGWRPRLTHWFKPVTPEATAAEQAAYQAILNNALPEAERIRRMVECELAAIAHIVAKLEPGAKPLREVERSARVLASLTRTLQEVIRLSEPNGEGARAEHDDDRPPAEPDEFVRDLVRRMDEFARRRQAPLSDEPAGHTS